MHKVHTASNTIDLQYMGGEIEANIPMQAFYEVIRTAGNFKRIQHLSNDEEFLSALKAHSDF